jgi:hypothetical protein
MFDFNSLDSWIHSNWGEDTIENYMESIYGSEITLRSGARTLKNKPESVGPPMYLGNSDLMVMHPTPKDTYLINRWDDGYDRITVEFLEDPVWAIEFDWQIFPVTQGKADLTVKADGVTVFYFNNSANLQNGAMGHESITFSSPVRKLEFIDWRTAPIGIDNLFVSRQQIAPEPSASALFLLGGAGLAFARRRRLGRAGAADVPRGSSRS